MNAQVNWRRGAFAGAVSLLSVILYGAQLCLGQTGQAAAKVIESDQTAGSCEGINLETANFKVRNIRIDDPFLFLPWVKARQKRATSQITELIQGKPFTYADVSDKELKIIEDENFLPDTSEARVKLRLEFVSVENCTGGQVDVIYRIYSTQILPVLSARPEERVKERETPQTPAGQTTTLTKDSSPFHFVPTGGYDSTDLMFGGGRFEYKPRQIGKLPFQSAFIKAEASSIPWRIHSAWRRARACMVSNAA